MRRVHWLLLLSVGIFGAAACNSATQPAPPPAAAPQALRPTSTIKDIMDSIVDPNSDYLWESVATVITKAGTEERQPKSDEQWLDVRRHAVALVEAPNLLMMEGRQVAKPGEKADNPEVELSPEEILKAINDDRQAFVGFAHGLQDTATEMLKAIDARNAAGMIDAGEKIDTACENCHLKYWYPLEHQAAAAAAAKAAKQKS